MSRHTLKPLHDTNIEVVIGWDAPMATFFAQVIGPDENVLLDRGDVLDRITDPEEVLTLVSPYAEVPEGLSSTLSTESRPDVEGTSSMIEHTPAPMTTTWRAINVHPGTPYPDEPDETAPAGWYVIGGDDPEVADAVLSVEYAVDETGGEAAERLARAIAVALTHSADAL